MTGRDFMEIGPEERRVAIEAMANLAHLKADMVNFILKPAGVPVDVFQPLIRMRDPGTGERLSKRAIAPLIIDALDRLPNGQQVLRSIIQITSRWNSYHLAHDEYEARATVEKAKEVLAFLEASEARAAAELRERQQYLKSAEVERQRLFGQQMDLLVMQFDEMARLGDDTAQRRGHLLEDLLNRVFSLCEIPVVRSFTRSQGGEQIDGAFRFEGWHYLVECKWCKKLADINELDSLSGKVGRSGKQTMGLFLAVQGWSTRVISLLKQNPEKCIILMDGYDLRVVLQRVVGLDELVRAKLSVLNLEGEPYLGVLSCLTRPGV
jgi:hypothetical protein